MVEFTPREVIRIIPAKFHIQIGNDDKTANLPLFTNVMQNHIVNFFEGMPQICIVCKADKAIQ